MYSKKTSRLQNHIEYIIFYDFELWMTPLNACFNKDNKFPEVQSYPTSIDWKC